MGDKRAIDAVIASIAGRQHGVVSVGQLARAGAGKHAIHTRVRAGRLHRIHRGVYAVGHRGLGNEGKWMAAVLALGEGAALSHRSAAQLWQLLPPSPGSVDVAVGGVGGRKKRLGVRIHRSPSLTKSDVIRRDGIPVTAPARTLRDLKRVVPAVEFRKAVRQAGVLGYELGGIAVDHTRSELEYLFLRLCRRQRLPSPEVNVRVGAFLVDFLWREQRLVVETDGRKYHRGALASAEDTARDRQLRRWGYEVKRFGHHDVTQAPAAVAASIRMALAP
jgi:very-short-patch-repair endonuclease